MTTNIGKHCMAKDLIVENLLVKNTANFPHVKHGSVSHDHDISSNGSIVYFKYALTLEVDKFSVVNNSKTITCVFKTDHHFDGTESGVKIQFSGGTLTGNTRGLSIDDFTSSKPTLNAFDSNNLSSDTMTFEGDTLATSSGDITVSEGMVGTILIYKFLDLAGPSVSWQIEYDQAPNALHP